MQRSKIKKSLSFSLSNLNYYQPNKVLNTTRTLYQARNGNKQSDTFRKKRSSVFGQLNYSSTLNPFARAKFTRPDRTAKDLKETKRKVQPKSSMPTDPITLRFQIPDREIRMNPEFNSSIQYKRATERKYFLPTQRQYSLNNKYYHKQLGMNYSCQKSPQTRETINSSSNIKPVLQYVEANHRMPEITSKIGYS